MRYTFIISIWFLICSGNCYHGQKPITDLEESAILFYEVNPKKEEVSLFWKDSTGEIINTFQRLKSKVEKEGKTLLFAMNGGMYLKDYSPQGLYIENGIELKKIDTVQKAYGNFYMQPNGIFTLDKNGEATVCPTYLFVNNETIAFATQSGPMLIIDSVLHSKFIKGSDNLNLRNGVGILPNGNVLFAMSKNEINFYDFAQFFLERGCKNALYLDGFVSRTYLPSQGFEQMEGKFGVIIGVTISKF